MSAYTEKGVERFYPQDINFLDSDSSIKKNKIQGSSFCTVPSEITDVTVVNETSPELLETLS